MIHQLKSIWLSRKECEETFSHNYQFLTAKEKNSSFHMMSKKFECWMTPQMSKTNSKAIEQHSTKILTLNDTTKTNLTTKTTSPTTLWAWSTFRNQPRWATQSPKLAIFHNQKRTWSRTTSSKSQSSKSKITVSEPWSDNLYQPDQKMWAITHVGKLATRISGSTNLANLLQNLIWWSRNTWRGRKEWKRILWKVFLR